MKKKPASPAPASGTGKTAKEPVRLRSRSPAAEMGIVERERAEQALRESEERFRSIMEQSPFPIVVYSPSGDVLYLNNAMLQLWDITRELAMKFNVFKDPQLEALGILPLLRRGFAGEQMVLPPTEFDSREALGAGRKKVVQGDLFPIRNAKGEVTSVILVHRDITERLQAEAVVHAAKERLRLALEVTGAGVWEMDVRTDRVTVDPKFLVKLGYAPEEAPTTSQEWISMVHPADQSRVPAAFRELVQGEVESCNVEHRVRKKDGGWVWTTTRACVAERAPNGAPVRMIGTFSDITARKHAELIVQRHSQLGPELGSATSASSAAEAVADAADDLLGWDACCVKLCSPDLSEGRILLSVDTIDGKRRRVETVTHPEIAAIEGKAMGQGPQLVLRGVTDPVPDVVGFEDKTQPFASLLVVPLRHQGRNVGILSVQSRKSNAYTAASLGLLQTLADHTAGTLERIRAEEAFRQSEARHRGLMEAMMDGFVVVDLAGRLLEFNQAYMTMLGYCAEELRNLTYMDLTPPQWHASEADIIENQTRVRGFSDVYEKEYRRKDGSTIQVELRTHVVYSTAGVPTGLWAIVRDVTRRKSIEQNLQQSEAVLASVFATTPAGVALVVDRKFLKVNAALCRMSGYSEEELSGHSTRILYPSDEGFERIARDLYPLVEKNGSGILEGRLRRKDGKLIDVLLGASPLDSEEGRRGMAVAVLDITERKQAEDELAHAQALLLAAIEQSPAGMLIADAPDVKIRVANSAALGMRGICPDSLTDIPSELHPKRWQVFWPNGALVASEDLPLTRAVRKGETVSNMEVVVRHADGTDRHILANAAPVRDASGKVVAGVVVFPDITELKRAEAALQASEVRARQQREAVAALALEEKSETGDLSTAFHHLTRKLGETMRVERASIWLLSEDDTELQCLSLFEASKNLHSSGALLKTAESPAYFEAIRSEHRVAASEALSDPRLSALRDEYLKPFGITSLLDAGIYSGGKLVGVVSVEHIGLPRSWQPDEESFIATAAALAAQVLANAERKRAERVVRRLSELGRQLSAATSATAAAEAVARVADDLLGWDACFLELRSADQTVATYLFNMDLVNGRRQNVDATSGNDVTEIERRVMNDGAQLILREGPEADSRFVRFGDVNRPSASLMYVPLRHQERYLGLFSIQSYRRQAYTRANLDLLQTLADYAAGALERIRAEEAFRESEGRNRQQAALLEVSHDATMVWDVENGIQWMNPAAEELSGMTILQAKSQPLPDVLRFRSGVALEVAIQAVTTVGSWTGELTLLTANDVARVVASRWTMLPSSKGMPASILITCNDITEKKQLENQYLRAQRLESVGTLASGVAHDLNNILSPVLMGVELLAMQSQDEDNRGILKMMKESAHRGVDTVKQLLTFARGADAQKGPVQPRHLLKEIAQLLQQTLPKNIQIYTDIAQEPRTVLADPSQLHQVLMNLCVNARDAMPEGGVLYIKLENLNLDEAGAKIHPKARPILYVVFKVSDSGMGIPAEILDRVFDPFFTTKPQGKGTGLGLATVLGIVEEHGGFVTVESKLAQGTTFRVFLPASAPSERAGSGEEVPAPPRGQGELILVVDDEAAILHLASEILRHGGYTTLTASNASEALRLYERNNHCIRAVLTDMMMPFGDGRQLIAVLFDQEPGLPIIAMSGLATKEFQRETLLRGARKFVRKPFAAEELLRLLADLLR